MNTESSRQRGMQGYGGFTILEIMFVVLIIGIIMAVAIPRFVRIRDAAKGKEAAAALEILAAGVNQLAWDTGKWPGGTERTARGDMEVWNLRTAVGGLILADSRFSEWNGPYVPSVPTDPWGNPYFFDPDYLIGGTWHVVIGSFGPNGVGRNVYDADNICVTLAVRP